ncbi:MAG TPA: phosphopantetheine-binding protein [Solirubrobacterales bacterium]|nr:phosphopantetheine-binding protein [Solirubrobacterales bacterium]
MSDGDDSLVNPEVKAIWSEVLEVEPLDAASDFFELGGHSLLAVRLLARIEEEVGWAVPLSLLFAHPTLGDFCAEASAAAAS